MKTIKPITLICKECGKDFVFDVNEQQFLKSKSLEQPKRCLNCRKIRKAAKEELEKSRKWAEDERKLADLIKSLPYKNIALTDLYMNNPDKSLVVIGNGFDIMHGVKSSYWEFQKTIGKNCLLRYEMETYLDVDSDALWYNLEDSLGRLDYSMFLNDDVIDMFLYDFNAYDPDAQAADFFAAIETAIAPSFDIPQELNKRLRRWVKTLSVGSADRPFKFLHGNYRVFSFNYTEFIETLYDAKNVCYIHGCRKNNGDLILGHKLGMEDEQWNKVEFKSRKFKDTYKQSMFEAAIDTAISETSWYDDATTKNVPEIIKNHQKFFIALKEIEEIFVIGHSLSEVDCPYFEEIRKKCNAKWFIGYHSYDDMRRLVDIVKHLGIKDVTVFRT